ncbi:MAG: IS66 family insertion sequence element accessory protein TnpB [Serratia sp. (in: enterobacteria)]|uniref:IS66 family insertion sequence element accessory protein TnpB n=1 Tax=Serratia sp. (in: enterobacteria) TaxID=616 RepID=UPI003F402BC9
MLIPHTVWLAREPVDMRQGIDALTRFVAEHLPGQWQQGAAVVFCNRTRSRIRVLQWDKHGVWLCARRLHRGHFTWPRQGDDTWQMTAEQFSWLVIGVDWQQVDGLALPQWET